MGSTRRAILKGATALGSLFLSREVRAQTAAVPVPAATPTPAPASTTPPPAEPGPLARAARERFGKYLAPEELKMLDEEMAGIERRGARLSAVALKNGEEPATDFRVTRA